jgi:simple sugar transport system permease protein
MPEFPISLDFLNAAIRLSCPVILAAMGAVITGKSGILNFALEGMMLLGAFLAVVVSYFVQSSWLGVLAATISGMILAWLFAILYLRYKVDLIVLAIAFNILVAEVTVFFLQSIFGVSGALMDDRIVPLAKIQIPFISDVPIIGRVISGHNLIVYLSWVSVVIVYFVLYRTRFGRRVRATGENIEATRSAGVDVDQIRLLTLLISGALAGLAGGYLSVGHLAMFSTGMSGGRGFSALVASLFAGNHPVGTFLASLFFGVSDALAMRLQGLGVLDPNLVLMLPHLATILVLTIMGLRKYVRSSSNRRRFREEQLRRLEASG